MHRISRDQLMKWSECSRFTMTIHWWFILHCGIRTLFILLTTREDFWRQSHPIIKGVRNGRIKYMQCWTIWTWKPAKHGKIINAFWHWIKCVSMHQHRFVAWLEGTKGLANGTGGGKVTVIEHGELYALFATHNAKCRITIKRCHVMPSNKHNALGLAPFKKAGCTKKIHSMHGYVEFHLENGKKTTLPITLISNSLDYVRLEITLPESYKSSNHRNKEVIIILETNLVRMNETTLNNALTVHENGVH